MPNAPTDGVRLGSDKRNDSSLRRLVRIGLVALVLAGSGLAVTACDTDGAGYRPPPQDWPPRRTPGGSD